MLWEYSQEESTAALTTEFLALGNHRKSIASEIAVVSERSAPPSRGHREPRPRRRLQLEGLSPAALLFLVTGIPKLIRLERGVGLTSTHDEVLEFFETYLDAAEPRGTTGSRKGRSKAKPASR